MKRTTIQLPDDMHMSFRLKALEMNTTMTEVLQEFVRIFVAAGDACMESLKTKKKGSSTEPTDAVREWMFKDIDARLTALHQNVQTRLANSAKTHLEPTKFLSLAKRALQVLSSKTAERKKAHAEAKRCAK